MVHSHSVCRLTTTDCHVVDRETVERTKVAKLVDWLGVRAVSNGRS